MNASNKSGLLALATAVLLATAAGPGAHAGPSPWGSPQSKAPDPWTSGKHPPARGFRAGNGANDCKAVYSSTAETKCPPDHIQVAPEGDCAAKEVCTLYSQPNSGNATTSTTAVCRTKGWKYSASCVAE
jgi:hypothetical protein